MEIVKKSKHFLPFLEILSLYLPFFFFFFLIYFILFYIIFFFPGMTTRFSKQKLAKAQEKKAKGGIVSGLLSKKKMGDVSKKEPVITYSPT